MLGIALVSASAVARYSAYASSCERRLSVPDRARSPLRCAFSGVFGASVATFLAGRTQKLSSLSLRVACCSTSGSREHARSRRKPGGWSVTIRPARQPVRLSAERRRIIPSHVKLEVWQRDAGKCAICGARRPSLRSYRSLLEGRHVRDGCKRAAAMRPPQSREVGSHRMTASD